MFNEEIEMTLECAVKVRKHLVRILENRNDARLEAKLQYVNSLIMQADSMQNKMLAVA
ncbi:hypothetical protein SAMN05421640_0537 [Ekhidna lutea]|uniref:Uncharacterized protein n=1 Tax=Ekhidna lutea TaxID=447679 RepID=A0A239F820_EKHLU|nr:hypothetical protein [Ekhidna lutea]SNS52965.1 hypothetical protein SAMN05421640_0537 [Ekhidna lutea]